MSTQIKFAGLTLRNPIVAASCGRTSNAQANLELDKAGVGAIVLKSLFEENIIFQSESIVSSAEHGEGADYAHGYLRSHALSEYIKLIKESKSLCEVPIIASISCVDSGEWVEFAKLIEEAGADALELNVMDIVTATAYTDGEFEKRHVNIATSVLKAIKIPVIVKLGSSLTNPVAVASRLKACGVAAVVMFNRMYQSDINIDKMEYTTGEILSSKESFAEPLRWVGIASAKVAGMDFALSGGVQNGEDVIKSLLAGASAVEVCSALYRNGNGWVAEATQAIENWQEKMGFKSAQEYVGRLNATEQQEREMLVRVQFLSHFGSMK